MKKRIVHNPCPSRRADVLAALPGTQKEIAAKAGCSIRCVCQWLSEFEKSGEAHISKWIRVFGAGKSPAYYCAGPGKRAPRSPQTANALYSQRCREKRKAQRLAHEEAHKFDAVRPRLPRRDPLVSAFFGASL